MPEPAPFDDGYLRMDFEARRVSAAHREVHLTPHEYGLLRELVLFAGRTVSHQHFLIAVWGEEYRDDTGILRVHVKHLRDKIEPDASHPRLVITQPSVGYRFQPASAWRDASSQAAEPRAHDYQI